MELIKLNEFSRVYCVESFWDEFRALFKRDSAEYTKYLSKLYESVSMLDSGSCAIKLPRFEKLENANGLYAIRHKSKLNLRVIFTFQLEGSVIVLLTAFKEKNKSDYDTAIKRSKQIMKGLEE